MSLLVVFVGILIEKLNLGALLPLREKKMSVSNHARLRNPLEPDEAHSYINRDLLYRIWQNSCAVL